MRTLFLCVGATIAATPAAIAQHTHEVPVQAPATPASRPWSQADAIHGEAAMDSARAHALHEMGGMTNTFFIADKLEVQSNDDGRALAWNMQAWHGGDIDRFWFKSEGHVDIDDGNVEDVSIQALWSHAISTYWDVQAGLRYDIEPDGLAHAVAGVQGLAPYMFEIDAAAFLSENGDVTARAEAEYELHLTQRLILRPNIALELSAQDIPDREIGSGLTSASAGLRLRYEITREFAPYIGVAWQRRFGETADYAIASGSEPDARYWIAGLRIWY